MSIDNYPDDIRMYDDDPRSPFYEEPEPCKVCGEIPDKRGDCDCDKYNCEYD